MEGPPVWVFFLILPVFALFQRPFLVPWDQIRAEPVKKILFVEVVRLKFGDPEAGRLTIRAASWERLAAHLPARARR